MKKFILNFTLIVFMVCVGFTDNEAGPVIRKFKLVSCNKRDELKEGVLYRNFKNSTLRLKIRITGSDHEILQIDKFSGDTLYLSLHHKPTMVIDTINGKVDTAYIERGCFCDFYTDLEMTIDDLKGDPKCIRLKTYVIEGELMKRYDKNGKLGSPRDDSKTNRK